MQQTTAYADPTTASGMKSPKPYQNSPIHPNHAVTHGPEDLACGDEDLILFSTKHNIIQKRPTHMACTVINK